MTLLDQINALLTGYAIGLGLLLLAGLACLLLELREAMERRQRAALAACKPVDFQLQENGHEVAEMAKQVEAATWNFVTRQWKAHPRQVIMTGPVGVGKTRVMWKAFEWVRDIEWDALAGKWEWEPKRVFTTFKEHLKAKGRELYRNHTCSFLFLDDVKVSLDTFTDNEVTDKMSELLNMRQKRGWTVMATNVMPSVWDSVWGEEVRDTLMEEWTVVSLWDTKPWSEI